MGAQQKSKTFSSMRTFTLAVLSLTCAVTMACTPGDGHNHGHTHRRVKEEPKPFYEQSWSYFKTNIWANRMYRALFLIGVFVVYSILERLFKKMCKRGKAEAKKAPKSKEAKENKKKKSPKKTKKED